MFYGVPIPKTHCSACLQHAEVLESRPHPILRKSYWTDCFEPPNERFKNQVCVALSVGQGRAWTISSRPIASSNCRLLTSAHTLVATLADAMTQTIDQREEKGYGEGEKMGWRKRFRVPPR